MAYSLGFGQGGDERERIRGRSSPYFKGHYGLVFGGVGLGLVFFGGGGGVEITGRESSERSAREAGGKVGVLPDCAELGKTVAGGGCNEGTHVV